MSNESVWDYKYSKMKVRNKRKWIYEVNLKYKK